MSSEFKLVPALADDEIQFAIEEAISLGYPAADIWSTAVAAAPQPPALGGEPEVLGYLNKETGKFARPLSHVNASGFNTALVDRAHIAPLQAENKRLKSAAETLARMGYTDNGGELWRPPLGKKPDFDLIDQLKARCDELEALLREVAALDPRGEFMGWQLDGRIDAALSKPAGSEQV